MSSQSFTRRAASPESSPEHGYANAPGPQHEENDDAVFLFFVPLRRRLHPRRPQTAGPFSSGGTSTNPIVVADDEDTPSTAEDDENENNVPSPAPTDNGNTRARAHPTTAAGNAVSSSIAIEDSDDEVPSVRASRDSNKRERPPSPSNNSATRRRHQ
ncbi:uncharacterized protein NECHADRAFT_77446 [Fusarium vanettenii 77-13-4]|uniref:Uncharacterized protein n=1 Tax=Fusarium vanettenii (strain ATCC MYA-4622 / CBS 123669 / FGSC 9596 / NRRL 45880 / 77-13-4) TaxID=660122 RepID=C7YL90_FUSV7|nr:uncharacterized protein NECHADRAFT_77446 [Fusarium vanettenii 77-13-4]EEU47217.1 predicted protein [Fusarium vanettenii 77-13-4]